MIKDKEESEKQHLKDQLVKVKPTLLANVDGNRE